MICFHFSIFVLLETANIVWMTESSALWFAFILVSLSYWKQQTVLTTSWVLVVICFHFSIFVLLETAQLSKRFWLKRLWFAFILVSLSYWKQHKIKRTRKHRVVICFHFSIFVLLETALKIKTQASICCDLLSF